MVFNARSSFSGSLKNFRIINPGAKPGRVLPDPAGAWGPSVPPAPRPWAPHAPLTVSAFLTAMPTGEPAPSSPPPCLPHLASRWCSVSSNSMVPRVCWCPPRMRLGLPGPRPRAPLRPVLMPLMMCLVCFVSPLEHALWGAGATLPQLMAPAPDPRLAHKRHATIGFD